MGKKFVLTLTLQQAPPLLAAGMPHLLWLRGGIFALQSSLCFLIFYSTKLLNPDPIMMQIHNIGLKIFRFQVPEII